ncbi:MAG TPA: hypothetical protein PKJ72_14210 [Deltaproteobacteria bacterium]|nr:hypothetical protein [Deltaproteobacteria bacterium]
MTIRKGMTYQSRKNRMHGRGYFLQAYAVREIAVIMNIFSTKMVRARSRCLNMRIRKLKSDDMPMVKHSSRVKNLSGSLSFIPSLHAEYIGILRRR